MLDSLQTILNKNDLPALIFHLDYRPILDHYLKTGNLTRIEQYVGIMLREQEAFKERSVNYNLVESI